VVAPRGEVGLKDYVMVDELPLDDGELTAYQRAMLGEVQRVARTLTASSDKRFNTVWEYTQSAIAVLVVVTTCAGVMWLANTRLPPEWWTIVGLVVGFYFGRQRPPAMFRTGLERTRIGDKEEVKELVADVGHTNDKPST